MRFLVPFSFFAFFLSGFTALIYELTWVRLLKHVFGSDSLALSTMLTVFIGGIALGTFLSGRLINRYFKTSPDLNENDAHLINIGQSYVLLYSYAALELLLGLYALVVPFLLGPNILGKLWSLFAAFSVENFLIAALIKFILSACLLIVPTLLMGMGFPVLAELLTISTRNESQETKTEGGQLAVSNLYATNTLGAIVGALLGGFLLLPQLGLGLSVYLAAAVNFLIVALVALAFYLNRDILGDSPAKKVFTFVFDYANKLRAELNLSSSISSVNKNTDEYQRYYKVFAILLLVAFTIGFLNLALEVLWTKVLTLVIGSSTYSLTIILASVLAGISFGAYVLNGVLSIIHAMKMDYLRFLKISLFTFAILITISSSLFNKLPWLFIKLNNFISTNIMEFFVDKWFFENLAKFSVSALIVFPVTFIEGIIFAFILFLVASDTDLIDKADLEPVGTRVARASYFNTFGAILGSFLTGFVLMPFFSRFGSGVFYSLKFLIVIAFLLALAPYLLEKFNRFKLQILPPIIAMVLALIFLPQLNPKEISSGAGIYQGHKFKNLTKQRYKKAIDQEILFHKEGLNNIVTVTRNKVVNAVFLKNNGKIEAGRPLDPSEPSKADMLTQVLLGQIPALIHDRAEKALLVGMGSGISLKELAKVGKLGRLYEIDVVEIEKLVYEAADKFFTKFYPSGVKINRHVADARNYLQALLNDEESSSYDIIISQPSDPWISGSLFTKEFWQLASSNLSDNGIFVQWLQLYSIDPEYLTIALRTFQSIFPEVHVFRSGRAAELILVGSRTQLEINPEEIREKIARKALRSDLEAISISDDADFLANLILVPNAVRKLLSDNQPLTASKQQGLGMVKFISKIPKQTKVHKPKLTSENLKEEEDQYLEAVDEFKGRTSTDDNMLLEFHTSRKLQEFFKTLKANERFLAKYAKPDLILKYFAENSDRSFLFRLAIANKSYGKALAESLHAIDKSPASYWTLYEIYRREGEFEKADATLFEARSRFADLMLNKKKLVLFEGLIGSYTLDDYQLASLSRIHLESRNFSMARTLVKKAINYAKENTEKETILKSKLASLYALDADIYADEAKRLGSSKKLISRAFDSYHRAIDNDSSCSYNYLKLAKFELIRARASKSEREKMLKAALRNLEKSIKANTNNPKAHLKLAEIYLSRLPDSQLAMMKSRDSYDLKKSIKYLRNVLILKPKSIQANYHMADLQYRIGNIDLAYKHSKRLNRLCENLDCEELLGKNYQKAQNLKAKLTKLVPSNR